jgi:Transposase DDE domain group 1
LVTKGFQVSTIFHKWFNKCKRRIKLRLDKTKDTMTFQPQFSASNIHYEVSERNGAITCGGIGAMHTLAKKFGLIDSIDRHLNILKFHLPYQDSDHVLNIAYIPLCGGDCFQDIELRRNDENFLNALDTSRLPDPTTAADFCRRFDRLDIYTLMGIIDETRLKVWAKQPDDFFDCATIDMDGTKAGTTGECKHGMDISYDGVWCYHPLVLTLAQTGEALRIVNRSGNRPSHEGAAVEVDLVLLLLNKAGFRKIVLRGDTDFSQTAHLDGWDQNPKIRFYFGYDAMSNMKEIADNLPQSAWRPLVRPARYSVKTKPRRRPTNVKEQIVKERGYENLRLVSEDVAEFDYQPTACGKVYRMVVVRKNISVERGEQVLFPNDRYFFYITNDRDCTAAEVVFEANDRCNQENVIAQLKNGVHALQAPANTLESNWAYMVMTALGWNLKAWWALLLPVTGRWREKHLAEKECVLKMEFKTFLKAFMLLPCQIVKKGRKLVYRLLAWNPHLSIFFRLLDVLRC